MELTVGINRKSPLGAKPFKEVFVGFERVEAVRSIFGNDTDSILSALLVEVENGRGYMRINDEVGSVMVSAKYLKEGSDIYLYLDVVHELVHVRQRSEGKELWDRKYAYVDRPTEIEAYNLVVGEARRLGLKDEELVEYLRVEWVTEEEFTRMLKTLGVRGADPRPGRKRQTE